MQADIVIGSGYGDEAKGLVTDALSHRALLQGSSVCVVRFNGGAQAGHTVQTPQGHRHVFHHFGSGSLAGAPTHLGQRFVVQPMLFRSEREDLLSLNANLNISVDPRAYLTFPFDVMLNQAAEISRGSSRHGSCGVGFGEAVHRNEAGHPVHRVSVGELPQLGVEGLRQRWDAIVKTYLPARIQELGLPSDALDGYLTEQAFDRFTQDCAYLLDHCALALPSDLMVDQFILEGAQGLAIDEQIGVFPHVTRSKTGLPWALEFLNQTSFPKISARAWYLTRAYATRHGAGPLPHEGNIHIPGFSDPTNQPNDFQGKLRLAPLDVDAMEGRINSDLLRSGLLRGRVDLSLGMSVSCLDQMGGSVFLSDGRTRPSEDFASWLALRLGVEGVIQSWGPTRDTIRFGVPQPLPDPQIKVREE